MQPSIAIHSRIRIQQEGWEPTFLRKGIGLSKQPIIGFGSVFSDICLKSRLGDRKKFDALFANFSDFQFNLEILKYQEKIANQETLDTKKKYFH